MSYSYLSREGLALVLINAISASEGKDPVRLPRDYALSLTRDVLAAIDNAEVKPAVRPSMNIDPRALSTAR
jgi:hypothetical protein